MRSNSKIYIKRPQNPTLDRNKDNIIQHHDKLFAPTEHALYDTALIRSIT